MTSQVAVPFAEAGEPQEMPVAALQNLVRYHPDEGVRRRAFEAELRAWESVREPLAACLNGVKGTANTLARLSSPVTGRCGPLIALTDESGGGGRLVTVPMTPMLSRLTRLMPNRLVIDEVPAPANVMS